MLRLAKIVVASSAILIAAASHGNAAMQCGPHEKIAAALGEKFHENRKAMGIANQAAVFELFVSVKGTWTLTATNTKGLSCIVASGEAWQDAPMAVAGLES